MELRDYIRVIRKRWILITVCVLATTGIGAAVTIREPTVYQSSARLFIAKVDDSGKKAYEDGLFSQQRLTTYAELASGQEVADRVADDLNLDTSAGSLQGQITATVAPPSLLLSLTVQNADPALARKIADSASQQLIELIDELEDPPGPADAPISAAVIDSASSAAAVPRPLVRNVGLCLIFGLFLGLSLAVMLEVLPGLMQSPGGPPSPDAPGPSPRREEAAGVALTRQH